MRTKYSPTVAVALLGLSVGCTTDNSENEAEYADTTLEIYSRIIAMETSKGLGHVQEMAAYLAGELRAAGFPDDDVEIVPLDDTAAFIAKYRGDESSGRGPILLLAHMDVVEAFEKDWERPPFELTRDDTFFYARGAIDNKFGIAQLTSTFIRLKKAGFAPNRDLILVFTGDEESTMATTRYLANERPDLAAAEFALNSDAGGGSLADDGTAIAYGMQAAEKTYVSWEVTIRNPGGHSSLPRSDNAIYELADAVARIGRHRFPVRWSDMTLSYFRATGRQLGGELGDAMIGFADNPGIGRRPIAWRGNRPISGRRGRPAWRRCCGQDTPKTRYRNRRRPRSTAGCFRVCRSPRSKPSFGRSSLMPTPSSGSSTRPSRARFPSRDPTSLPPSARPCTRAIRACR